MLISSNPDSSDFAAEEQAEEEESAQHGASMTAALEAKVEQLKARKPKAVARATKYKQANKELREKAALVTPDSSSDDNAGVDDAFLDTLAQLVSQRAKKASAPMKAAEPRRPKSFNGEGEQDSAGGVRRFVDALSLFFELSKLAPELWATNARQVP